MRSSYGVVGAGLLLAATMGSMSPAFGDSVVSVVADSDISLELGVWAPTFALSTTDASSIPLELGSNVDFGAALNFDLSGLPTGATITSATLVLDMIDVALDSSSDGIRAAVFANDDGLAVDDFSDPFSIISSQYALDKPSGAGRFDLLFGNETWFPGGATIQEIFDSGASHLGILLQLDFFGMIGDHASFATTEGAAADASRFAPRLEFTYLSDSDFPVVPTPSAAWMGGAAMMGLVGMGWLRRRRAA